MRNLILAALFPSLLLSAQTREGMIRGVVLDPNSAVIPGATIQVVSQKNRCDTTSDQQGKFICRLPPDHYFIRATNFSFLPYRRASISLSPAADVFVSIRTVPAPARGTQVTAEGLKSVVLDPASQITYQDVTLTNGTDVVIRFSEMKMAGDRITFDGPHLMLSVGRLSAYGDKLICTESLDTCTASGSVLVELGEEQLTGNEVEIDLVMRKILLRRDPTAARTF